MLKVDSDLTGLVQQLDTGSFQKYGPFTLNGLTVWTYYAVFSLGEGMTFDYIWYNFSGAEGCGIASVVLYRDEELKHEADVSIPEILGFLTSFSEQTGAEE